MTRFALRCIAYGLLWGLAVVGAMIWAMESSPSQWGCIKLVAAFLLSFVAGVFTFMRDPEKAWRETPTMKL